MNGRRCLHLSRKAPGRAEWAPGHGYILGAQSWSSTFCHQPLHRGGLAPGSLISRTRSKSILFPPFLRPASASLGAGEESAGVSTPHVPDRHRCSLLINRQMLVCIFYQREVCHQDLVCQVIRERQENIPWGGGGATLELAGNRGGVGMDG